jgi:hypothetical protein
MHKLSDVSCKCCINGPEHEKGFLKYQFRTIDNKKFFRFEDTDSKHVIYVPVGLVDELRQDEWVYDSSLHNNRKEKVK